MSNYDSTHRILVIANESCVDGALHDLVSDHTHRRLGDESAVFVVAPSSNTREAELRLCDCVERLRRRGIEAAAMVGDEDPLQAIEDVLRVYPADELIVSTSARDVVARAQERFGLPTSHVEVDRPEASRTGLTYLGARRSSACALPRSASKLPSRQTSPRP